MYAQMLYAVGDPAKIEDSIEALRIEGAKLLADLPGFRSFGLAADRDLGKISMASWWETEHERSASNDQLAERHTAWLSPFADCVISEEYDVAAVGLTPQLTEAKVFQLGRFEVEPSRIDELVSVFKDTALPRMEGLSQFAGTALLLDRTRGRGAAGILFTDREGLKASRSAQSVARRRAVELTGLQVYAFEEFEELLIEQSPQ